MQVASFAEVPHIQRCWKSKHASSLFYGLTRGPQRGKFAIFYSAKARVLSEPLKWRVSFHHFVGPSHGEKVEKVSHCFPVPSTSLYGGEKERESALTLIINRITWGWKQEPFSPLALAVPSRVEWLKLPVSGLPQMSALLRAVASKYGWWLEIFNKLIENIFSWALSPGYFYSTG